MRLSQWNDSILLLWVYEFLFIFCNCQFHQISQNFTFPIVTIEIAADSILRWNRIIALSERKSQKKDEMFLENHDVVMTTINTYFYQSKKAAPNKNMILFYLSALLALIKSIEHVILALWILIRWQMSINFDC